MLFKLLCYKIYNSTKTTLEKVIRDPPAKHSVNLPLISIQVYCNYINMSRYQCVL